MPRDIWVLVGAALAVALGYGIVAPILPTFAKSFDVSITAANALVSVFAGMRLAFATPGGKLIDKFGERRMYMSGLLIVAASTLACGFATTYWQLFIFRGLGGVGSVVFSVSAMSLVIKLAPPDRRGRASALYGGAFLMGNILGPVLGSALAGFGMRVPFFIYAGTLVVAFAVVWLLLPPTSGSSVPEGDEAPRPTATVRGALQSPVYQAALGTNFVNAWTNFGVRVSLIPLFVAALATTEDWLSGAALTSFAIGNALMLLVGGGWSDRFGRAAVVVPGLMISGTFTIILGFQTNPYLIVATCFVAGMGAGLINPGQQGAIADVLDGRTGGKLVSTFQMAGDLAQIIGPLAVGLIADSVGFTWAFGVSGVLLLVGVLFWPRARHSRPFASD